MTNTIALILAALIQVESAGQVAAVGDGGRAWGVLQIHAAVITDVNRVSGSSYIHADAFDPATARRIATIYLTHYAGRARPRAPAAMSDEELLARVWNGGPTGWAKSATARYWKRVEAELTTKKGDA